MDSFEEHNVKLNHLGNNVECNHCGAIKLPGEVSSLCCNNGKIKLKPFKLPKHFIKIYDSKNFMRNSRAFNSMFAFTSIGTKVDKTAHDAISQCYRVSGQFYHQIGSLFSSDDNPKFAQIYMYDPSFQLYKRKGIFSKIDTSIMKNLTSLLHKFNPYVKTFKMAREHNDDVEDLSINLHHLDDKIYNTPTTNEVAAIIIDGTEGRPRDIRLKGNDSSLKRISDLHSAYDPLQYPLIHPKGTQGWHDNIYKINGKDKVTQREFYAYHGFSRNINKSNNPLECVGPLAQQWWVDQYCKIENNRLNWLQFNQKKLRIATKQSVQNAVCNGQKKVGKILLPSSYVGSPRYYYEQFLDAMAGVRKFGQPDFFITMTANTKWAEIQNELKPGELPSNRPMLLARVFKQKMKVLIKRIMQGDIFGPMEVHVGTIEFQKRGIPHAHLLFILKPGHKISEKNIQEYDKFVYAEIPDKSKNPTLYKRVTSHMIHKPCHMIDSSCTNNNGSCKSDYPKDFSEKTKIDDRGYPLYRRRNNGRTVQKIYNGKRIYVDNRNIVPYNPTLLLEFDCHINVEIVSSLASVKYLFKYLHKGTPKSSICINKDSDEFNEIKKFVSGRYISAGDACWRILGFPLIEKDFIVERLPVHLPDMQSIVFKGNDLCDPLVFHRKEKTKLTQFFQFCKNHQSLKIVYDDIPSYAVWSNSSQKWNQQKRIRKRIGRINSVNVLEGERFYLRLLLQNVISPQSFKELRTVQRQTYNTFKDAATARGLVRSDHQNYEMLDEASSYEMPKQLRQTFASMLLFCCPLNPKKLFEKFFHKLTEDYFLENPYLS